MNATNDRPDIGQPIDRTDGALKFCGLAPYAAEFSVPHALAAAGRHSFDQAKARADKPQKVQDDDADSTRGDTHVVLAAMASQQVGRPVKLVLDRTQMFGPVGNRPKTEQFFAWRPWPMVAWRRRSTNWLST